MANLSVNTSWAVAYTPSSLDPPASFSTSWMSLMVWLSWLTHCTGSVCSVSLSSTTIPADEDPDARDREQHGRPRRDAAEPDDQSAERTGAEVATLGGRLELADAEDGQREDDRADADRGDADREQQSEVADHRHLGEVERGEREDGVEGDDEQRGTEVAGRLLDRMLGAVDHHLFLDACVHLDRVVDPDAEHHREPRDRHDGERDAEVAGEAERPDHADQHDEERQEPPPHPEQEDAGSAP